MRKMSVLGAAALLAATPAFVQAQTAAGSADVVVKENTTVVVKEAPKPSPVTFTPYGFFLFNAFFNDAAGSTNYPYPRACIGGASCEGNILLDVRQTRLGTRLAFNDEAGWTKAKLSALVEVDFQGGYNGTPTGSFAFYSPLLRLRKAYADAAWGLGGNNTLALRLGQDDIITSPLRATSLAWVANPLFQFAGVLNGRAPMLALRYDLNPKDGLAVSAVVAAVNPQDNTVTTTGTTGEISPSSAIDLGAGNRSRIPSFQGRVGLGWKTGGKMLANLQGWAGWQKNAFVSPFTDTRVDQSVNIIGGDLTLDIWMVKAMGSIYSAKGWDQAGSLGAAQGVAVSVQTPAGATKYAITATSAVPALGGWFQILVGPADLFQVYGGWGGTQSSTADMAGSLLAVAGTRVQNFQWAAGLIGYAGKNWRFSAEYSRATSFFYNGSCYNQGQFALSSQVVF